MKKFVTKGQHVAAMAEAMLEVQDGQLLDFCDQSLGVNFDSFTEEDLSLLTSLETEDAIVEFVTSKVMTAAGQHLDKVHGALSTVGSHVASGLSHVGTLAAAHPAAAAGVALAAGAAAALRARKNAKARAAAKALQSRPY